MRFEGATRVMTRVGVREGFWDQPLPLTCAVRGLTSTGGGPPVTEQYAHSGARSVVIEHGRFWPALPQVQLKANTRYRLQAWTKLVEWTDEERQANEEKRRPEIERQRAEGQDVPEFEGFSRAEAFITADLCEASPHGNVWVRKMQTTSARPDGPEWQKVNVAFTTPEWAPFVNVAFYANAGTAYLDDFELVELRP